MATLTVWMPLYNIWRKTGPDGSLTSLNLRPEESSQRSKTGRCQMVFDTLLQLQAQIDLWGLLTETVAHSQEHQAFKPYFPHIVAEVTIWFLFYFPWGWMQQQYYSGFNRFYWDLQTEHSPITIKSVNASRESIIILISVCVWLCVCVCVCLLKIQNMFLYFGQRICRLPLYTCP